MASGVVPGRRLCSIPTPPLRYKARVSRLPLLLLFVACTRPSQKPAEPSTPAAAPASSAPSTAGQDDRLGALYAGMFSKGATFEYELSAYKVDEMGDRSGPVSKHVSCRVTDVVVMHESNALSARLACDEPGPLEGVMFATDDGFWWYDRERYAGGGFVMDGSTKIFDREPRQIESSEDRMYSVQHEPDGRWCWSESFDRPWTRQGLCFAGGKLVSGWAATEASANQKGDYIEFRLAQ